MDTEQRRFLADEFFSMTLMATVQRAHVYRDGAPDAARQQFRDGLRRELERLVEVYKVEVSDDVHLRNICELSDHLSLSHGDALRPDELGDGRFRIGPAPKALNLWLKYMWCLGEIPTPPHCPFDSNIIYRLRGCEDVKWTKLDSLDEYMKLVRTARQEAKGRSLAEWELKVFNEEAWGS